MSFSPTKRQEFMTKRMNLPEVDLESCRTMGGNYSYKPTVSILERKQCMSGLDYASIKDFAAVGLVMITFGNLIPLYVKAF